MARQSQPSGALAVGRLVARHRCASAVAVWSRAGALHRRLAALHQRTSQVGRAGRWRRRLGAPLTSIVSCAAARRQRGARRSARVCRCLVQRARFRRQRASLRRVASAAGRRRRQRALRHLRQSGARDADVIRPHSSLTAPARSTRRRPILRCTSRSDTARRSPTRPRRAPLRQRRAAPAKPSAAAPARCSASASSRPK